MNTSYCKEQPKKQEDVARRKELKEEETGSGNSSIDSIKSHLWLRTRLPNLYTTWIGPLVRVKYSGLTQSVFRMGRVKSSSCDWKLSRKYTCVFQFT
jgi:hypothetical protein